MVRVGLEDLPQAPFGANIVAAVFVEHSEVDQRVDRRGRGIAHALVERQGFVLLTNQIEQVCESEHRVGAVRVGSDGCPEFGDGVDFLAAGEQVGRGVEVTLGLGGITLRRGTCTDDHIHWICRHTASTKVRAISTVAPRKALVRDRARVRCHRGGDCAAYRYG